MTRKVIYFPHWVLFFLFVVMAIGAFAALLLTERLAFAGIIATGAALIATASAFLERLFPR